MSVTQLLLSLVIIYVAAKVGGELAVRIGQPSVLGELLGGVVIGVSGFHLIDPKAEVIHLLAERFKITRKVGEYKATHDLPPADPAREAQQIARLRALAHDADLDPEFGESFLRFIISEVIRHHEKARS